MTLRRPSETAELLARAQKRGWQLSPKAVKALGRTRTLATMGRVGAGVVKGLGVASLPFLPMTISDLVDAFGTDTFAERDWASRDRRIERLGSILPAAEEYGARADAIGTNRLLDQQASVFEGAQSLQSAIGRRQARALGLEELIEDDRGMLGQLSKQSQPSIMEMYAKAGLI